MDTSRSPSRNQYAGYSTGSLATLGLGTAAVPLRAKVASITHIDLVSISHPLNPTTIATGSTPSTSATTLPNSRGVKNNSSSAPLQQPPPPQQQQHPVRLASARIRSSNSVVSATSSYCRGSGGSVVGVNNRKESNTAPKSTIATTRTRSASSDDNSSNMSDDSDLTRGTPPFQPGGGGGSGGVRRGGSGSVLSISSTTKSTKPKSTIGTSSTMAQRRTSPPSTVGYSGGSKSVVGTTRSKPMRMAAGASMSLNSPVSSSFPSTPGVSSIMTGSGAGSGHVKVSASGSARQGSHIISTGYSYGGDDDDDRSSMVSVNSTYSTVSTSNHNSNPNPNPNIRSAGRALAHAHASISSPSAASAVAAANRQAEENRRTEEAARTRRKIADLEISNASLLSINQSLEATIRKQANEMQELKTRIQSSHFGELGYSAADMTLAWSGDAVELPEGQEHEAWAFKQCCQSIEQMIFEARQALDQSTKPVGKRVLSLYDMYEKEVAEETTVLEQAQPRCDSDPADDQDGQDSIDTISVSQYQDDNFDRQISIQNTTPPSTDKVSKDEQERGRIVETNNRGNIVINTNVKDISKKSPMPSPPLSSGVVFSGILGTPLAVAT